MVVLCVSVVNPMYASAGWSGVCMSTHWWCGTPSFASVCRISLISQFGAGSGVFDVTCQTCDWRHSLSSRSTSFSKSLLSVSE